MELSAPFQKIFDKSVKNCRLKMQSILYHFGDLQELSKAPLKIRLENKSNLVFENLTPTKILTNQVEEKFAISFEFSKSDP